MSITDAFRNLNSSIRGIKEDDARHEERKMQLENQKIQIQGEINNPVNKLKRQQAQAQLKITNVGNIGFSPEGKSNFQVTVWNREVLPELQLAAPADAEVSNKGNLVFKGTETPYQAPAWKAKEIQAKLGMAFALSNLKDKAINREITDLDTRINDLLAIKKDKKGVGDKSKNGGLTIKQNLDLQNFTQKRSKMIDDRDNPAKYSARLMSDTKTMMDNLDVLSRMSSHDPTMAAAMQKRITGNNNMIASLAKTAEAGTTASAKWLINRQRETKVNKEYMALKAKILATTSDVAKERFVLSQIAEGKNRQDIETMISSGKGPILEKWKTGIAGMEEQYGGEYWFHPNVAAREKARAKEAKDPLDPFGFNKEKKK